MIEKVFFFWIFVFTVDGTEVGRQEDVAGDVVLVGHVEEPVDDVALLPLRRRLLRPIVAGRTILH